jgi:acyl-CoA thioester hydrolase
MCYSFIRLAAMLRNAPSGIIPVMSAFRFIHPIEIRYSDLDPQWHVNHARFISFLEQARFRYVMDLGLFDGRSFLDFEFIIADLHIAYLAPIHAGQPVHVAMRVTRLGNKSLDIMYRIEDEPGEQVFATAETVMVIYDYRTQQTRPISDLWREKIAAFEDIPPGPTPKDKKE